MKKQLSLALLTLNIFTLNILPAKAVDTLGSNSINSTEYNNNNESAFLIDGSRWCVEVPWLLFVCF